MIRIAPIRRRNFDGELCEFESGLARSLACCYADSSTANPINPQGTAGGGNVLNAGSIFGNQSLLASGSSGDNGAGTGSADTAALGGPATGGAVTPTVVGGSGLSSLLSSPAVLIGGAVAILLVIGGIIFALIRRKK